MLTDLDDACMEGFQGRVSWFCGGGICGEFPNQNGRANRRQPEQRLTIYEHIITYMPIPAMV